MAAEAQRAPRVAREQTNMADAAVTFSSRIALSVETLSEFSINETHPFRDEPNELARDMLDEAHALSIILANLLADTPEGQRTVSDFHLARGVAAINTLIALASFAIEARS